MAASLLTSEVCTLEEAPLLEDVHVACEVLKCFGSRINIWNHTITIDNRNIYLGEAPYELVKKMRASFLVMGPLLARFGQVRISLPGAAIGRAIDPTQGLPLWGRDSPRTRVYRSRSIVLR